MLSRYNSLKYLFCLLQCLVLYCGPFHAIIFEFMCALILFTSICRASIYEFRSIVSCFLSFRWLVVNMCYSTGLITPPGAYIEFFLIVLCQFYKYASCYEKLICRSLHACRYHSLVLCWFWFTDNVSVPDIFSRCGSKSYNFSQNLNFS